MAILPKAINVFDVILIQIPVTFCTEIKKKSVLKYVSKHKRPQIAKAVLSKSSNTGGIRIPKLKLYYRAITIKTGWFWHKNRQEEQWIRIEDLNINPCIYSQLIFDKGVQTTKWKQDSLFNKRCWENCRRLKLDPCLSPCTKINSKWIKDFKIRPTTLK
jgi:hypothetical protein